MSRKEELRNIVKNRLEESVHLLNRALNGEGLDGLESVVARLSRNGRQPHWYSQLKEEKTLPNMDGKTIGSVLEMLFVAVLEVYILNTAEISPLRINPARGVDLPDIDLGVKSPSENYCTSEPFFSAYERLYGNNHDCVVLLTDYQTAKRTPPIKLKVIDYKYLRGSEVADENLCRIAKNHREWLVRDEVSQAKRVFRFLAYVNQSDWRAKHLLAMVGGLNKGDAWVDDAISSAELDYRRKNRERERRNKELIPVFDIEAIQRIGAISPRYIGVIGQLDNWVVDFLSDAARAPNDNEWERLISGDLDGKIGMSFALQWRFNFSKLFGGGEESDAE